MTPLFNKLNFKSQKEILVLNSPESFEKELTPMVGFTSVKTSGENTESIEFILIFVTRQSEIDSYARAISNKLLGDAIVWFAYPKASSKKYRCEFNRDNGWSIMGKLGLEPVRMVAIDQDWSAIRFRKVEFIKTMTRSFALSDAGKKKVAKGKPVGTKKSFKKR